jgi:hypothetical protein
MEQCSSAKAKEIRALREILNGNILRKYARNRTAINREHRFAKHIHHNKPK